MVQRLQEAEPPPTALPHSAGRKASTVAAAASSAPGVLLFAGEATDREDMQQVHGAMRSGVRAAEQILQRLQRAAAQHTEKRSSMHK
jgi:hypothetical protein